MRQRIRLMAWVVLAIVSVTFMVGTVIVVLAASHTITYTTQQDNLIVNKLIPAINRNRCQQYGKPPTCTSADLVAAGCVVRDMCDDLGLNQASNACTSTDDMKTNSCTVFAQTAAGQDAMMREALNNQYVAAYSASESQGSQDFKAQFDASSQAAQDASCTAIGLPAGCAGP